MTKENIQSKIVGFISNNVFSGKIPADFTNNSPLVSSRLMNSITVLQMVSFLEEELKVEFEAHEISADNLDTVNILTDFIAKKLNVK